VDRKELLENLAKDETPNKIMHSFCKVYKINAM